MTQASNTGVSRILRGDKMERRTVAGTEIGVVQYGGNFQFDNYIAALTLATHQCGDEGPEHYHPGLDELFLVIAGEGEVVINGVAHHLEEADVVIVRTGDNHYLRGKSPLTPFVVYCILVPPLKCDCKTAVHACGVVPEGPWKVEV